MRQQQKPTSLAYPSASTVKSARFLDRYEGLPQCHGFQPLFTCCFYFRRRQVQARRLIAPIPRRASVDGSGTDVRLSLNAVGPPGMAAMVNVE